MKGIDPKHGGEVERAADDNEPLSAIAFKIVTDPYVGRLAYFRVYSGVLKAGESIYNSTKDETRAHRPPAPDARQPARGNPRRSTPAASPPWSA